jgi:pyruvate,water dikinase
MSVRSGPRLLPLTEVSADDTRIAGAKAARLAKALGLGLPVLPGWVVPAAEGEQALAAGAACVRDGHPEAARRAVLGQPMAEGLAGELGDAAARLGGRVVIRSSSSLECDTRWAGAFRSMAEVGPEDAATAVRSCWASAFAVDPLARLSACGLPADSLQLAVLIQRELRPTAGGVARVIAPADYAVDHAPSDAGVVAEVHIEGVRGHPGPLLTGWAEGASARIALAQGAEALRGTAAPGPADNDLAGLVGASVVSAVADMAGRVWQLLGDDVIEWAAEGDQIWLLQSLRESPVRQTAAIRPPSAGLTPSPVLQLMSRNLMPELASVIFARGQRLSARPAATGTAAGRLLACRPHERPETALSESILLVDRPVPALAPLLFAARGVVARTGSAGSHLAEVARCLGVPMVIGCRPDTATTSPGPAGGSWLVAIDGATGDVAVVRAD